MIDIWKKTAEILAYKGYRQMVRRTFLLPNERTAEYDIMISRPFVSVAALTTNNELIMVRQFRPGPERVLLGFVDGQIDDNELPVATAHRELLEETGYKCASMRHVKTVLDAYTNLSKHIFIALDCELVATPKYDENEFLETILMPIAAFEAVVFDAQNDEITHPDVGLFLLNYLKK